MIRTLDAVEETSIENRQPSFLQVDNTHVPSSRLDVLRNNPHHNQYNEMNAVKSNDNCCVLMKEKLWDDSSCSQKVLTSVLCCCSSLVLGLMLYSFFVYK